MRMPLRAPPAAIGSWLLVLGSVCFAQPAGSKPTVRVTDVALPASVRAGQIFEAGVKVAIAPEFHIYGLEKSASNPQPTAFQVGKDATKGLAIAGKITASPPPKRLGDAYMSYEAWEDEVTFKVPLKLEGVSAGSEAKVVLAMEYMACTMEFCLPPGKAEAKGKVKVEEGAASEPPAKQEPAPAEGGKPPAKTGGDEGGKPEPEAAEKEPASEAARGGEDSGGQEQESSTPGDAKLAGEKVHVKDAILKRDPADPKRFVATIKLAIEPPFHIYGLEPMDIAEPTSITIAKETPGFEIPAGSVKADRPPQDHQGTQYWEQRVTFTVPVVAKAEPAGMVNVALEVAYTPCDESSCLMGDTLRLPFLMADGAEESESLAATDVPDSAGGASEDGARPAEITARVVASFEGTLAPDTPGILVIPVPASMAGGTALRDAKIRIAAERRKVSAASKGGTGLPIKVSGEPVLARAGTGEVLRVPVTVSGEAFYEGAFSATGNVRIAGTRIDFEAEGIVHQSILAFLLFAAAGAAAALLTPCVFPMIPVTVSFFTKQGEKTHHKPVTLGLTYCIGIVLSFVAIGVIFTLALGASGASNFATHWLTCLVIAALFILFAVSLFGAFELQLPPSVMRLVGSAQRKGGTAGIWMLGLLFSVTTFACTAPIVGSLLASAASTGEWTRPVLGMLVFASVLAVPFFFLSAFPSRLKSLPKSGGWLNEVKVCMGFVELAAAFKFLAQMDVGLGWNVFTRSLVLCAWIAIFAVMGVYLLGVFRMPHDTPKEKVGVIGLLFALLSIGFAIYLTRGLPGENLHPQIEPWLPPEDPARLARLHADAGGGSGGIGGGVLGKAALEKAPEFKNDYEGALAKARETGRALFVNFTGFA